MNQRHRRAATLLDVAIGSMMFSLLLIPLMKLTSDAQRKHHQLNLADGMLFEADQLLEKAKIELSEPAYFGKVLQSPMPVNQQVKISMTDDLTLIGQVSINRPAGINVDNLIVIQATVWNDLNQNGKIDPTEPQETLSTQWAAP